MQRELQAAGRGEDRLRLIHTSEMRLLTATHCNTLQHTAT